ncbi:unnamed protein product, partial [Mesorhabditis belari]|uniref:Major facilitator superfamily (MFS) profile domain-containing protein n=1 Tax=Mesorhabditis belari TaxID=2138241 RepID=A0AAF3ERN9_9BILA
MAAIKVPEFPKAKLLGSRFRFALLILLFLCLTAIWSNILTYNIAIVCMSANSSSNHDVHTRIFTNGQSTLAVVFVAIGNIIAAMPVIMLVNRYGTRTVLGVLGLCSSVATFFIPLAIRHSIAAFYILRMIQGTALACNFPVIGYFTERWTYFKQNGMFISVLVTYLQLAPAFTNPVSGALCSAAGWPSVFYFHGGLSLGLFLIYAVVFRNNPEKHPFVGNTEKTKIAKGKITAEKPPVPYLSIIKTPAIWGVWIAGLGNFTVINLLFLYTPTYLHKVVGFGETSTGLTSAIVPIAEGIVKIISGVVSDKLPIRESIKVRLFNTIAFIGSAVFLAIIAFAKIHNGPVSLVLLALSGGFIGLNTGGFYRAAPILSKQFGSFVTGAISLCMSITMLILPFFVQGVAKKNTEGQWEIVFFGFVSNIFFVILVRGEPCWWTKVPSDQSQTSDDIPPQGTDSKLEKNEKESINA